MKTRQDMDAIFESVNNEIVTIERFIDKKEKIIINFLCGNCGYKVKKWWNFCPECGQKINWENDETKKK